MTAMLSEPGYYDDRPPGGSRPRITWPGGARIAFWVAPNLEFYELDPPRNPSRTLWSRPVPDILGYGKRDYGNRVGFHRLAAVMRERGFPGSVSLSLALCDHYPEIVERCCAMDWELFSHGIYNTRYLYNMTDDQVREVIRDCQDSLRRHTGRTLQGWLSPALSATPTTQHLLAEAGLRYTLDFYHDDQPTPIRVRSGRLVNVPYSLTVNDHPLFLMQNVSPDEYESILRAQFDRLHEEGAENGTVMCVPVHPYIIAQPHRLAAFARLLDYVNTRDGVWRPTAAEIAAHYYAHHYDDAVAAAAGTPS